MYSYQSNTGGMSGGFVVCIIFMLFLIACQWRVFTKAGKHGWAALVPIYNSYVLFDIIYGCGWKFLLCCIPVIGWIVPLVSTFRLAKCFNKGFGFGLGLLFLPFIFLPILAFGKSEYYDTINSFI